MGSNLYLIVTLLCISSTFSLKTIYPLGSNDVVLNPERGFRTQGTVDPARVQDIISNCNGLNATVVQAYGNLLSYVGQGIPQTVLDGYSTFFDGMRKAGLKVLLRFSYEVTESDTIGPTFSDIFRHIDQLVPITQANADVIMAMQAGFIGAFGEWHDSVHHLEADGANLALLLYKELVEMLPSDRQIQVRVPFQKYNALKLGTLPGMDWSVITESTGHSSALFARIGFHMDHFLSPGATGNMDEYTFPNYPPQDPPLYAAPGNADFDYVAQESPYVFVDGEFPWSSSAIVSPTDAYQRFRRHHFTTFSAIHSNAPYGKRSETRSAEIINAWAASNLQAPGSWAYVGAWHVPVSAYYLLWQHSWFDYFRDHLGYRLEIQSATFTDSVPVNGQFNLSVVLRNLGTAPPHSPRPVYLVWIDSQNTAVFTSPIKADPRKWQTYFLGDPEFTLIPWKISTSVQIPQTLAAGTYQFGVFLPDMRDTSFSNSLYAIRFANVIPYFTTENEYAGGGWGVNILGEVTVTSSSSSQILLPTKITSQPQPATVVEGTRASFGITASGSSIHYQWLRNGIPIPGATSSTYTTGVLSIAADSWSLFSCIITSSSATTIISNSALLKVITSTPVPPTVTISSPSSGRLYQGGSTVSFSGSAADIQDGDLPAGSLSWTITFTDVTAGTTTTVFGPRAASSGNFIIPNNIAASFQQYYTFILTATNSHGLRSSSSVQITPQLGYSTLTTNLAGLLFSISKDGTTLSSLPYSFTSVVGNVHQVSAVSALQSLLGKSYTFLSWSDGYGLTRPLEILPGSNTYTATFQLRVSVINVFQMDGYVLTAHGILPGSAIVASQVIGAPSLRQQFAFTTDGYIQSMSNPDLVIGVSRKPPTAGTTLVLVNRYIDTSTYHKWQIHAWQPDYKYIQNMAVPTLTFAICKSGCYLPNLMKVDTKIATYNTIQYFYNKPVPENEYIIMTNAAGALALTASSVNQGATLSSQSIPYSGSQSAPPDAQKWLWNPQSGFISLYTNQDLVLGFSGTLAVGSHLALVSLTTQNNAAIQWSISYGTGGAIFTSQTKVGTTNVCMDLSPENTSAGAKLVVSICWTTWWQQWRLDHRPTFPSIFS